MNVLQAVASILLMSWYGTLPDELQSMSDEFEPVVIVQLTVWRA